VGRLPLRAGLIVSFAVFDRSSLRTFYVLFIQFLLVFVSNSYGRKRANKGEIEGMWIHEVAPERLAELFHHYQQALMPEVSGKGSEGQGAWKEVPQKEKSRLVAAARLALLELESMVDDHSRARQYFAQPGEAEWGC